MELCTRKAIEALIGKRYRLAVMRKRAREVLRAFPRWFTHPVVEYTVKAALTTPLFAPMNSWLWGSIFAAVVVYILLADLVKKAHEHSFSANYIEVRRATLELALTKIRTVFLSGTSCRVTILLPRKEGERWELVAVLRSESTSVANSRVLQINPNDTDGCVGVAGRAFKSGTGFLERACLPSPEYPKVMFVDHAFIEEGKKFPECRRNPTYVFAHVLRSEERRVGVLVVDTDQAQSLVATDESHEHFSSFKKKLKAEHEKRRRSLEAIALVLPMLGLDSLFTACGVLHDHSR